MCPLFVFDFNKNWEFNRFEYISSVLEVRDMSAVTAAYSSHY
jgi:hypothetical protein